MESRIVIVSGPGAGTVAEVAEGEISIGRDSTNSISISDTAISRKHCVITINAQQPTLKDLNSRHGTFVNGVPVTEVNLHQGDHIQIGGSMLLFMPREQEGKVAPFRLKERLETTKQEFPAILADIPARPSALGQMARDLHALLKISANINSLRDPVQLQEELLKLLLEVLPAQRCAVLFPSDNSKEFNTSVTYRRSEQDTNVIRPDRDVVEKALLARTAILTAASSTEQTRVACAPLIGLDHIVGVVYLETDQDDLKEDHRQFVAALMPIAAIALENALALDQLKRENQRLLTELEVEHNLIGESPPMRTVTTFIGKVAPAGSTVLIRGESGTGKELVARAIHSNSPRANNPFIAINCAALTESLLESEMFGHEKGAFTGAIAQKKGKIELANEGTLFLDEVGELAPLLQGKLLRVLQEREFERVGGTKSIKVDIRVIAATNRDLNAAVKAGTFRQDLFYRLNVVSLTLAPLRERREDIPLLAAHFIAKYSKSCKRLVKGLSPQARTLLLGYAWPGNIRELENAIERAVVLGTTDLIMSDDLPETILETQPPASTAAGHNYHDAINEAKRNLILYAMEQSQGNYTEAARLLDVHPNYLHRLIRNLGIRSRARGRRHQ